MALITWIDDLCVGIPEIDDQHRTIMDQINQLCRIIIDPNQQFLLLDYVQSFSDYVRHHFSTEEALFDEVLYSGGKYHKQVHASIIDKMARLQFEIAAHEEIDWMAVLNYVETWFLDHIHEEDIKFGRFLKERNLVPQFSEVQESQS